jgi:hypothetical protein
LGFSASTAAAVSMKTRTSGLPRGSNKNPGTGRNRTRVSPRHCRNIEENAEMQFIDTYAELTTAIRADGPT